jgi:hypothetical protein
MKNRSSTAAEPPGMSGVGVELGSGIMMNALYILNPTGVLLASARNLLVRDTPRGYVDGSQMNGT